MSNSSIAIEKLLSRDGVREFWVEFPETYDTDMHKMAHVDDLPSRPDDSTHVIEAAHVAKLEAALKVAIGALAEVSKGHSVSRINYNYFHEDSQETGMIKTEILVTKETEKARQALAEIERIAGGDKGDVYMNEWDFEFVFDPHDEFFGMTEQQWNYLHDCKVRVKFIPIEDEPMQPESKGD